MNDVSLTAGRTVNGLWHADDVSLEALLQEMLSHDCGVGVGVVTTNHNHAIQVLSNAGLHRCMPTRECM